MAQQPSSRLSLPSSGYASQMGLAVAFARLLRSRPGLDRRSLYALVTRFSQASSTIAAHDYEARRAGVGSRFTVRLADPLTTEQFSKTLNYVFADPHAVEDRMVEAFTRLALQGGRRTVVEAVQEDRQARGWARETRGDCCYFCAMLASRGAVYKDEHTAGRTANAKFVGEGEFKFHNNCHCTAVPVFGTYEKTAEARAWTRQWHDLRRDLGRSPSLLEWRRHFESRTTTDQPATSGS